MRLASAIRPTRNFLPGDCDCFDTFSYGDLSPSSPLPKPRISSTYWVFCSVPSSRLLYIVMETLMKVRIEQLYVQLMEGLMETLIEIQIERSHVQLMETLMVTFVRLCEYAAGQVGDRRLGRELGRFLLEKALKKLFRPTPFSIAWKFSRTWIPSFLLGTFFIEIWNALVYNTQIAEELRRNPAIFWCHRRTAELCIDFITISIFIPPARSTYKGLFYLESGKAVFFYVGFWFEL